MDAKSETTAPLTPKKEARDEKPVTAKTPEQIIKAAEKKVSRRNLSSRRFIPLSSHRTVSSTVQDPLTASLWNRSQPGKC